MKNLRVTQEQLRSLCPQTTHIYYIIYNIGAHYK